MNTRTVACVSWIAAICSAVASCEHASTRIELTVTAPSGLALDALAVVTPIGERRVHAMVDQLALVVPDEWAGTVQRLQLDGVQAQEVVAVGILDVTPVLGETVAARVTLVPASCTLACVVDAQRCENDAAATCEVGDDGCPRWGAARPCPATEPFCSQGVCGASPPLTVVLAGDGDGAVTSSPTGIDCGLGQTSCTASYATGTSVTLSASAGTASSFAGWSGAGCSGTGECLVTLSTSTTVTATFSGPCPETTCGPVEVADAQSGPRGIAVDASHIYWVSDTGSRVMRRSTMLGAATVEPVATAEDGALGIAVDASHVYWTTNIGDSVMRRAKGLGAAAVEIVATSQDGANGVAVDDTHVYWTTSNSSTVMRRAKALGVTAFETVATGQDGAFGIAVDASHVYWTAITTGAVRRRAKGLGAAPVETVATGQQGAFDVALDDTHVYCVTGWAK